MIVKCFVTLCPFLFWGRERELDALLSLSSWCHMQFVIVIFPNHTQLLYLGVIHTNRYGFGEWSTLSHRLSSKFLCGGSNGD